MGLEQVLAQLEQRGLLDRVRVIVAEDVRIELSGARNEPDAPALSKGDLEARAQYERDRLTADLYAAADGI